MKTMTCKSLGGPCEQKLSAGSWEEMVAIMTRHVIQQHPDTAKEMEKMHNQDSQKMGKRNQTEVGCHPRDLTESATPVQAFFFESLTSPAGRGHPAGSDVFKTLAAPSAFRRLEARPPIAFRPL
jgi:predicted small metal-binding protein